MIQKWLKPKIFLIGLACSTLTATAQQTKEQVVSVDALFSLVEKNHPSLKVHKSDIGIAEQNVLVAKNQLLPEFTAGVQAYYLGDAHIIDKDFSNATRVKMPHFGNNFSVEARQLIWKGGVVRNAIEVQNLRQGLAELNYEGNEQNIKLLTLGYYLDLYKLHNQAEVYKNNIRLAEQRLENIKKFNNQGMVTKNDVIRGELQLSNLKLALQVVENNQAILNKQLLVAAGLDASIKIVPDTSVLKTSVSALPLSSYLQASAQHPAMRMAEKSIDIYATAEKISRAEMKPSLSAFGGNSLQRPITSSSPARDMYTNGWSAGLSLNFNIDALFKAPKKVQLNRLEKEKALLQASELDQMLEVAINAAYIKYNEAHTQNNTLRKNKELTEENYRIMESKYNNQLAILLDLIDASNAKLDAELQYANSEINIAFSYYKLKKEAGVL